MRLRVRSIAADDADDVAIGQALVREYVIATAEEQRRPDRSLDIEELLPYVPDYHDLAGRYLHGGAFLIADVDDALAGCVGVTPMDDGVCEMNRLWVRPEFRRDGVGRTLAIESMDEARRLGFRRMILDVLETRTRAIELYRNLGFTDAPASHSYVFDFDMVFLGRDL